MKVSIGSISGSNFSPPSLLALPVQVRKVRDSGSLLLMLAFLGFLAYIIWDGLYVRQTDVNLVIHGHDNFGNICGRNNKPIKLANRSGRNFTDKPYTKYTLIDSDFERYTLDSSRTRYGELIYVREKDQLERLLQDAGRNQSFKERQQDHLQHKPIVLFQRPSNSISTSRGDQFRLANAQGLNRLSGMANRSFQTDARGENIYFNQNTTTARVAPKLNLMEPKSNNSDIPRHAYGNENDRYDHELVTPVSVLTLGQGRGISQSEIAHKLLYLTECVPSCPPDYVELIFYRCMPNNWRLSLFPNAINVTRTFIDDILTDVGHCYRELIYTFSLALVISLALLVLLRFLASIIIWTCIVTLISIFLAMASYSWLTFYQHIMDLNQIVPNDSIFSERLASSDRWLIGSIFLTFIAFAAIAMVLFMRKRILLVTMLFRESGKAIADMPMLLLQPLLTFAVLIGITVAWVLGLICLQSMKEPHVDLATGFVIFKSETLYKVMKWYHMFAFLWVSHFAIACQHYVIGASVSKWYFSTNRYTLSSPIGNSISELILYYLGSVALGSFLVAIFKVVRILTRQIQFLIQRSCMSPPANSHTQSMSQLTNQTPSPTTLCGSCGYIWRLFIWFFDNIVMIISRDAYVEVAIHGHSFLGGARRAFSVLSSNPLRLLAIKSVGNILLVMAKICVVVGTVSMAHLLLQDKNQHLNYAWSPIVISAIYAYIVAHWFLSVYEMVIDALFICYCEDYEHTKSLDASQQQQQINGTNFMTQILKSGQIY